MLRVRKPKQLELELHDVPPETLLARDTVVLNEKHRLVHQASINQDFEELKIRLGDLITTAQLMYSRSYVPEDDASEDEGTAN